jgi:hypothetical protein
VRGEQQQVGAEGGPDRLTGETGQNLVGSHLQRLDQANFHKDDLARLARLTTLPPRSPPYLVADSDLRSSQAATTTAMGTTR